MQKRSKKPKKDINQLAAYITAQAIGQLPETSAVGIKNPAVMSLGRAGGKKRPVAKKRR